LKSTRMNSFPKYIFKIAAKWLLEHIIYLRN